MTTRRPGIVTIHINPPYSVRAFDWLAHYDDQTHETRPFGMGATEAEAIQELKTLHPR